MDGRENLHKIVEENEYHVQEWYPLISEFTFPTVFLPLTLQEGKDIVRYLNLSVKDGDNRKFVCSTDVETKLRQAKAELETKIDDAIQSQGPNGAFVRLSSRSPKDAVSHKLYDLYIHERQTLIGEGMEDNEVTSKIAYTRANVRVLKVQNGAEAMALMLNSNRVHQDLQMMVKESKLGPQEVLTQVVIRAWCSILPELEFRAFVYGKKIRAITQYYKTTYVPSMKDQQEQLRDRMVSFFYANIVDKVPINDYVIDFAVTPDKIWIVELNNPPPVAGTALFDWDNEMDKITLELVCGLNPEVELEFRVLLQAPPNPLSDAQDFLQGEKEKREKSASKQTMKKRRLSF